MLMHHSEPLADANDPPQEVSIQLQQLAGDAQQEEIRKQKIKEQEELEAQHKLEEEKNSKNNI